jgi:translation initiation factor IF-2
LRASKTVADNLAKRVAQQKSKLAEMAAMAAKAEAPQTSEPLASQVLQKEQKEQTVAEVSAQTQPQTARVETKTVSDVSQSSQNAQEKNLAHKEQGQKQQQNQQKRFEGGNQNVQKRTFDANANLNRPDRQYRRPFDNRNAGGKQFQQGGGQQKPFGKQDNRPFGNKTFDKNKPSSKPGVGFVQSKGNNMRVFAPLESSAVFAQPERQFGNKNKTKNHDNDRTVKFNKKNDRRALIISTDDEFEEITMGSRKLIKSKKKAPTYVAPAIEHAVITTENITVKILSEAIGKPAAEIIKKLMILGIMATINSSIDFTTAELVANELGITIEQKLTQTAEQELTAFIEDVDDEKDLAPRPPVVAVMGHVDHGKTSLLDMIRKTNVVSGEAGGITQRIGAYQVVSNGQKITFLDTPGHAAFTAMRARGAKITDIAILVVAADDGIMPQTIEAMNHIKAAGIPMIVAINKMDKREANPERIKQQLSEHGALPEEWGGDTILVPVSAKTGVGIDNLLSMILLVAQMQELKANPNKLAIGAVIEAALDKTRGPVATVLVQNGTLRVGDTILSGLTYGKVKAMFDEHGNPIKEAGPATPVSVLGLNEVPQSGDQVVAVDEKLSKQVIEERKNKIKFDKTYTTSGVSLDNFMDKVNEGKLKNLNIIIKADVQGSVEALKQSLTAISNDEVRVVCVHSGAGPVTESDLVLAQASSSVVINFNLKTDNRIKSIADTMKVDIRDYKVIYEVVEEITNVVNGMRAKVYEKVVTGHAEVRVVFKLTSVGIVAGSYVTDGKIVRNGGARVLRDGQEIADTTIEALKIQKDEKAEVNYSYECGIKLKDFNEIKVGDIIECYQKVEVKK